MLPSSASSKARAAGKRTASPETLPSSSSSLISPSGSSIPRVASPLNPGRNLEPSPSPTAPQSASSGASSASTNRVFSDSPKAASAGLLTPPQIHQLLPSPMPATDMQPSRSRPRGQSTSNIHLDTEGGGGSGVTGGKAGKRISHPAPSMSSGIRRDHSLGHIGSHDDHYTISSAYPSDSHVSSVNQSRSGSLTFTSLPQSNPRGRSVSMAPRLENPSHRGRKSSRNTKGSGGSRSRSPDAIIELPGQEGVDGVVNSGLRPGEPVPGHLEGARMVSSASSSSSPSHSNLELPGIARPANGANASSFMPKSAPASVRHTPYDQPPPYLMKSYEETMYRSTASVSASLSGVWGDRKGPRPWHGSPQLEARRDAMMDEWERIRDGPKAKEKGKDIPEEQEEGWRATRDQVAQAAKSVLGTAGEVTHELLELGVDYLDFAPVPGLQTAVKTLLQIWDALQAVDLNRMACLGLVQDCASTVLAIRDEIHEAGISVAVETNKPFAELNEVFLSVKNMLESIAEMSFLKRYLKRDDVSRQIRGCHDKLDKALMHFDNSITLRVLKHVMFTRDQSEEIRIMVEKLYNKETPPSLSRPGNGPHPPTIAPQPSSQQSAKPDSDAWKTVIDVRSRLRDVENARDMADLRRLMQAALQAGSDVEMIRTLQVGRESMPDAIKALQREIEHEAQRNALAASSSGVSQGGTSTLMDTDARTPKIVRRVSITQVPVPFQVDAGGDVILEDVLDSPLSGGTGAVPTFPEDAQCSEDPAAASPPGERRVRSRTIVSIGSADSSYAEDSQPKDTLDMEFMESGLDALRRMSKGIDKTLPSWAITEFEIYREEQIGVGFFSEVYKGTWRSRTVAIKQLHRGTPQRPFVREVEIWKSLKHPNVLKLLGASTPSTPPYFLVSPYMKRGSLAEFLGRLARERETQVSNHGGGSPRSISTGLLRQGSSPRRSPSPRGRGRGSPGGGAGIGGWRMLSLPTSSVGGSIGPSGSGTGGSLSPELVETNLLRFMYEIARGMEYLHGQGVLHGDLKAANVLVNDKRRCVITDFGQSEMKSEAYRLSGAQQPRGTLRWQAPELMQGAPALTVHMDVYAFAITCVEILNMGKLPWSLMDDDSVRYFVLKENGRPPLPASRYATPQFEDLLRQAWHHEPSQRPHFSRLVPILKQMSQTFAIGGDDLVSPSMSDQFDLEPKQRPSPDMRPVPLPFDTSSGSEHVLDALGISPVSSDYESHRLAHDRSGSPPRLTHVSSDPEHGSQGTVNMPEPVIFHPSEVHSRASSDGEGVIDSTSHSHVDIYTYCGYDTPPPNEQLKQIRNERRYRMLLTHDFHPSLTLPLWSPSQVALGAVGYLLKPQGAFVTLFNATNPLNSAGVNMASLKGYGDFSTGKQRDNKRHLPQRWFDSFTSIFRGSSDPVRKYTFPLRAGHRHAYLCTETTQYRYFEDLETPKKWFTANVDSILDLYGAQHDIQKEDLYLVIGTLSAPNYGLFVSHSHPNGQAHFNIYGAQKSGQPWGSFTTGTELPQDNGPLYRENEVVEPQVASKVSIAGAGPWDSLLVAKLRFRPDAPEPTSL